MYRSPSHAPLEQLLSAWDFLVEVRSFRLDLSKGRHWTAAFKQAFDEWRFVLDEGGGLFMKRWYRGWSGTFFDRNAFEDVSLVDRDKFELDRLGTYQFFAPSEVTLPADLPPLACPLLCLPYGYIAIKIDWGAERYDVRQLVTALIKESMGRVFATEPARAQRVSRPARVRDLGVRLRQRHSIDRQHRGQHPVDIALRPRQGSPPRPGSS